MKFVLAGLFVIGFVMICYSVVKMQFDEPDIDNE